MPSSILALDLDGTIVNHSGILDPVLPFAATLLRAADVEVVIATGRSPWSGVRELGEMLRSDGPHIAIQGAIVFDPADGSRVFEHPIPGDVYLDALAVADELGITPIVATPWGHRAERSPDWRSAGPFVETEARAFRRVLDLSQLAAEAVFRVFLPTSPGFHQTVLDRALQRLDRRATVLWTDTTGVEILARGVDKGAALAWLADEMGVPMARVFVVGDGRNDIGMLRVAGRSAAMGHAPDEVRAAADIIVGTPERHGALEAMTWFYPELAHELVGLLDRFRTREEAIPVLA